ncbi:hypothetical protein [Granulicella sp. dw_53]|uniref:hypothetical protein n=1 Tax=Granulicella sp. dw_53 TaxID=2719792 RepID=UPI001BD212B6|nr:hypothetical protein [Granulicella sp. dw_53]
MASLSPRQLARGLRPVAPALVALSLAGVAHAQGTMDFSGAQTLMQTFNMGPSSIQERIVLSNPTQIVSKQPVGRFDRQREHIRDLEQHAQCGMDSRSMQVRNKVFGYQFAPFEGIALTVIRRPDLPMEIAQMNKNDLSPRNLSIHSEGFSSKSSTSELRQVILSCGLCSQFALTFQNWQEEEIADSGITTNISRF